MNIIVHQSRNIIAEFLANFNSEHTRKAYQNDIQKFFLTYPEVKAPSQLTLVHFIRFREILKAQGASPSSINRAVSSIRSLMDWCVVQGLIPVNPAASLKTPKATIVEPTLAFSDAEVTAILDLPAKTYTEVLHKTILSVLFNLGLRRSEIVSIKNSDIFRDHESWTLRVYGKGGKIRMLPITDTINDTILRYKKMYADSYGFPLEASDFLFQSNPKEKATKTMHPVTIYRIVTKYAKKVGVDRRVSTHSCRATVISHLLENNVSPRDVADFAGHSSIQTTIGSYDKKRDNNKNSAARKVNYRG